jgi:hypothetical protein
MAGESISAPIPVNDTSELYNLVRNPSEDVAFVNVHGETVPIPDIYFGPYVRIDTPLDRETVNGTETGNILTVEATVKTQGGIPLSQNPGVCFFENNGYDEGTCSMNLVDPVNHKWRASLQLRVTGYYFIGVSATTIHGVGTYINVYIRFIAKPQAPNLPSGGGGFRPPMPRCPYVCAWNGTKFVTDNNLLLGVGNFSVDYYVLEKPLAEGVSGNYSLKLQESSSKRSFIDVVKLRAVDHPSNVSIGVTPNGSITSYGDPHAFGSAIMCGGKDLRWWLKWQDDYSYKFQEGDWVDVCFGTLNVSSAAKLVLRMCSDEESTVFVQRYNSSCLWETVASVKPRALLSTQVLNLTGSLPDYFGQNDLRLVFNGGNCTVDFVGLDTSAEAHVVVHEAEFVSARDSIGINATFANLQYADGVCAWLKQPYTVDLHFRLPPSNGSGLRRDFIFVAEGYYVECGGRTFGVLSGSDAENMSVDWWDWFDLIEDNCRKKGWIWADVFGYDFYYFGNSEYCDFWGPSYSPLEDFWQPLEWGLTHFMGGTVKCHYYDGHTADRNLDFVERSGFDPLKTYDDLPDLVAASRPFATGDLLWNTVGYTDSVTDDFATASVVMNCTSGTGIFIHNGLAGEASDWTKGYIAAVLAIEEARAHIMEYADSEVAPSGYTNIHGAAFALTMVPGGRGEDYEVGEGIYDYVDLNMLISGRYENITIWDWAFYEYFLSAGDFFANSSDPTHIGFDINMKRSGLETGNKSRELMDRLLWWGAGFIASALGNYLGVPYLGSEVGGIPILIKDYPPDVEIPPVLGGSHVVLAGPRIDPNGDYWGTISCHLRAKFYKKDLSGEHSYVFNCCMISWLGYVKSFIVPLETHKRVYNAFLMCWKQVEFVVDWRLA